MSCSHSADRAGSSAQKGVVKPVVTGGVPSVSVPETSFNVGKMELYTESAHDFVVKNVGSGMLEIRGIKPG